MSDPKRLRHGARGAWVAELLAAGTDELPSEVALDRALKRVTLAAAAATLAHTAASKAAASGAGVQGASALSGSIQGAGVGLGAAKAGVPLAALAKWAGVAAVGIGVTSAAPSVVRWLEPAPELARSVAHQPAAGAPARAVTLPEPPLPPAALAPIEGAPPAPPQSDKAASGLRPAAKHPATTPMRGAREELRLVDAAREALQAGDAARSLDTLEHYETRITGRQFELEVALLRMEAFVRLGQMEAARRQARLLLARPLSERQAARARAVLAQKSFQ